MARNFGAAGNFGTGGGSASRSRDRQPVDAVVDASQLSVSEGTLDEAYDEPSDTSVVEDVPVRPMPRNFGHGAGLRAVVGPVGLSPEDGLADGPRVDVASDDVVSGSGGDVVAPAGDASLSDDVKVVVDKDVLDEGADDAREDAETEPVVDYGDVMRRPVPIDMGLPLPVRIVCVLFCAGASAVAAYLLAAAFLVGSPEQAVDETSAVASEPDIVITGPSSNATGGERPREGGAQNAGGVVTDGIANAAAGAVSPSDGIEDTGRGYGVSQVGASRDGSDGHIVLNGSLQNLTSEPHDSVAVGIYLYDADGSILGIATDYVDRVDSGAVWEFQAVGDVAYDKVGRFELAEVRW